MLSLQQLLATTAVLLGMLGCATTSEKATVLVKSVSRYNDAFRWKNYQVAAGYLPAKLRSEFIANYDEDDKELLVEGYQILGLEMLTSELAKVRVRYQYSLLPSVTLEKRIVTQHWAIVEGRWTLEHEDASIRPLDVPRETISTEAEEEVIEKREEWPNEDQPWYEPTPADSH